MNTLLFISLYLALETHNYTEEKNCNMAQHFLIRQALVSGFAYAHFALLEFILQQVV